MPTPQNQVIELVPPTRFLSPAGAGVALDIALAVTAGCALYEEITYVIGCHAVKSSSARTSLQLLDSMDGHTTRTHTGAVISSVLPVAGECLVGDADRTVIQLDRLHPVLRISSSGTGAQWMVLSVVQILKRFRPTVPDGGTRRLGIVRMDSGTIANANGYALPAMNGAERRIVRYDVNVLDASASAQVGCLIQHGADGERWATQKNSAAASVTAPTLLSFDCDTSKSIGPLVRPVLKMQSGSGQWAVCEVWETSKTVRG